MGRERPTRDPRPRGARAMRFMKSRDKAVERTKRFANPAGDGKGGAIEVGQLFELEDLGPGEAVERFRGPTGGTKEPSSRRSAEADAVPDGECRPGPSVARP